MGLGKRLNTDETAFLEGKRRKEKDPVCKKHRSLLVKRNSNHQIIPMESTPPNTDSLAALTPKYGATVISRSFTNTETNGKKEK